MPDGDLSVVLVTDQATFATRSDIETRLGRSLTDSESNKVDLLLVFATGAIAEACDKDLDWANTYDPVPTMLRIICVEAVWRTLTNPDGLKSGSESLGAYSRSGTYTDGGGGLALTDREVLLVRRAVYGRTTSSAPLGSIFQEAETT